jgi:hypothetical protein
MLVTSTTVFSLLDVIHLLFHFHLCFCCLLFIKILGSRATGKLAAACTSPGTKSGINSSPIKNTGEIQSSMSGEIQSSMSGEIQRSMSGGIQISMSGGTQRALVQSSLKLTMLIKELKAHIHSPAACNAPNKVQYLTRAPIQRTVLTEYRESTEY